MAKVRWYLFLKVTYTFPVLKRFQIVSATIVCCSQLAISIIELLRNLCNLKCYISTSAILVLNCVKQIRKQWILSTFFSNDCTNLICKCKIGLQYRQFFCSSISITEIYFNRFHRTSSTQVFVLKISRLSSSFCGKKPRVWMIPSF